MLKNSFGTQAALIAGCTVQSYTSIQALNNAENDSMRYVYWISTAFVMGLAIHTILSTMFLSVFGPGLALRGPEGSMVRAVKGMEIEQSSVLAAYVGTLISFAVMTMASFWLVMTQEAAAVSTAFLGVFAYFWWYYCLRIYNRFLFVPVNSEEWSGDEQTPTAKLGRRQPEKQSASSWFGGQKKSKNENTNDEDNNKKMQLINIEKEIKNINMEGFMTKKGASAGPLGDSFKRRYFKLTGSELRYYESHQDCKDEKSKKNRYALYLLM